MNNFEEACFISCEKWVNSFSDKDDFAFSKSFDKRMDILTDKMRNNRYHKMSRKTVRALIVAAIILSFATTALAIPSTRKYIIKQFKDHFLYTVTEIDEVNKIESISVQYTPEGFIKTDEEVSDIGIYNEYCKDELRFVIYKNPIDVSVNYDNNSYEVTEINNVEYVISELNNTIVIIWNNGLYTYRVSGNIDKELLLRIAENTI